jgi:hypothetical protein
MKISNDMREVEEGILRKEINESVKRNFFGTGVSEEANAIQGETTFEIETEDFMILLVLFLLL